MHTMPQQDHDCTHLTRQWMAAYLVAEEYDFESWGHSPGQFTVRILRNGVVWRIITAPDLRQAEEQALRTMEAERDATLAKMEIVDAAGGFSLIDRDTFNNWGALPEVFLTRQAAGNFALRVKAFKEGRRMTLEPLEREERS